MEISSIAEGEVLEFIKCDSCGFTEECTIAYISRIRERYCGMWICGLCIEAVKDEMLRSQRLISTEEALNRHISVCKKFQSITPSTSEHPIFAMGKILRKSLDSPRSVRSSPSSPLPEVNRSSSLVCSGGYFSALS
ncbi:hypothetical protein ACH5RR_003972 [Cinchona calisaya]|uniref:DUF1677 family protein n=1 Tax=Cinchona calisaya TaxID=153742 RepID=A0ABD3AWD3_9GENT